VTGVCCTTGRQDSMGSVTMRGAVGTSARAATAGRMHGVGGELMSRRRTPRDVLGPTGGAWVRMAPGWYRHEETRYRVMRVGSVWHVGGGRWDGAAFRTLWAAQTMVEGAGQLGDYRVGSQD